MKAMEPPGGEAALDRILAQAELRELPSRDDAVLPPRECRDSQVRVR